MSYKLALIAEHIQNSVSPIVYEYYAKQRGISISYEILNIPSQELKETIEYCRSHFDGFNITMPYKKQALTLMDAVEDSAEKCGSVNTVQIKNEKLIAYNTDGWGAVAALKLFNASIENAKIVMIGAGGVASAIAYNLKIAKVREVHVVNQNYSNAEKLCCTLGKCFYPYSLDDNTLSNLCEDADVLINASALGYLGKEDFQDVSFLQALPKHSAVLDVNYTNPDAILIRKAKEMGLNAHNGTCMTACQGIKAFSLWTGVEPKLEEAIDLINILNRKGQNV